MVLFFGTEVIHGQNCQTFNTLGKGDDSCAIEHECDEIIPPYPSKHTITNLDADEPKRRWGRPQNVAVPYATILPPAGDTVLASHATEEDGADGNSDFQMSMVFQKCAHIRFMKAYVNQRLGTQAVGMSNKRCHGGIGYAGPLFKKFKQWGNSASTGIVFIKGEILEPQTTHKITTSSTSKQHHGDTTVCYGDIDFEEDNKQVPIWEQLDQMDLAK